MKTVSQLILEYLARTPKEWKSGGELERNVTKLHKPATISRTLRQLAEDNLIYKDYVSQPRARTYVVYKFKK